MTVESLLNGSAADMAAAVRSGAVSGAALTRASLARIDATEGQVNAFTDITAQRATQTAAALDARLASGDTSAKALPLLGVPFAVKNLFDVAGLTTLAGSKVERGKPPAMKDSPLIVRLEAAGAVLAGALLPAAWVHQAQRVRRWFALRAAELFRDVDILLAPATPCPATEIGSEWIEINGQRLPTRANMGVLTQPISCIGLPVCAVPVWGCHASLPIGVQVIAAPWREDLVLRVAHHLERQGVVAAPVANLA